jgi:hypothetical protein
LQEDAIKSSRSESMKRILKSVTQRSRETEEQRGIFELETLYALCLCGEIFSGLLLRFY